MNWRSLHLLGAGVCVLLAACEKPTPFEITTPATPGNGVPAPLIDASLPPFDAAPTPRTDGAPTIEVPAEDFTQGNLLRAVGECGLERYRAFVTLATTLRDATRAYADAQETIARPQDAWRTADVAWQELEFFRFGPAGSSGLPGGKDLRNLIYYYPDSSDCQVDQALVNQAFLMGAQALNVSARGLGALEYLLFYSGDANSCSSGTLINTPASGGVTPWQAIDPAERARRRSAYATVLADDLLLQANALVAGWDPAQGNFLTQFATAGAGSTLFARAYDAFNVVDDAMWYLDVEVKDYKLAIPAGISPVCTPGPCPQLVESRFSSMSNANIRANISGFRLLFNGCGANYSGLGFDDWLRTIGRADLADSMTSALINADNAVAALPLPLEQMVTSNLLPVQQAYTAIQAVTTLFKADFTTALNLQRPAVNEGDND
ncbi:MAG TPA: imelysin family protein [Polyangiales bacterium]|nr:imelysin family protein [Polyangiales bacterium]